MSAPTYGMGYVQGQNDTLKQQNSFLQSMMMSGSGYFNQSAQFMNTLSQGLMQTASLSLMGGFARMGMGFGRW